MKNKKTLALALALVMLPACVFKKDGDEVKPKKSVKTKRSSFFSKGKGIPTAGSSRKDEGAYFDEEVERYALGEEFDVSDEMRIARGDQEGVEWTAVRKNDLGCEPVHFEFDSYKIEASEKPVLAYDIEQLKKAESELGDSAVIVLEGHADSHCRSRTYNVALSGRRAETAKSEAVAAGINPERLKVVAYGDMKPVVKTSEKERKNRRVEFTKAVARSTSPAA